MTKSNEQVKALINKLMAEKAMAQVMVREQIRVDDNWEKKVIPGAQASVNRPPFSNLTASPRNQRIPGNLITSKQKQYLLGLLKRARIGDSWVDDSMPRMRASRAIDILSTGFRATTPRSEMLQALRDSGFIP